jgi:isopenicillin N synthase-like dioxygenase
MATTQTETNKNNTKRQVPELSLLSFKNGTANDRATFVNDIMRGLKEYGFITLKDHPISKAAMDSAYAKVAQFFSLPVEEKIRFICDEGGGQRGYTGFGKEHAKTSSLPDLKEFWHVGREVPAGHKFANFYPKNVWPDDVVPGFRVALEKIYADLDATSGLLLDAIGMGLDMPQSFFRNMIHEGNSILRPIHYPPVTKDMPVGAVRSAAHEDINLITILMGATSSGLELLDRDGTWLPVDTKEGELIVDTGDMMSVLTNDVLPSTTHRVVNPADSSSNRYSMPFFVHPNPETELRCIDQCRGSGEKYAPINSHEFLLKRLSEIGLMK